MKIGYARVSTEEQNLELQLDALASANCEQIFQEKISGKNTDRTELQICLKTMRPGDTLITWRLDRLGRSIKDLISIVTNLQEREIVFVSLTENIDTSTASGNLIFHIFASLAEFERNLVRERTLAGLAAARARGRKGGRKRKLSNDDIRKAVAMLRDPDMTKAEVAKHFCVSRVTLNAVLKK